jgi:hypothetical protein
MSDDNGEQKPSSVKGFLVGLKNLVVALIGFAIIAAALLSIPAWVKIGAKAAGTIKKAAVDGWNEGSR